MCNGNTSDLVAVGRLLALFILTKRPRGAHIGNPNWGCRLRGRRRHDYLGVRSDCYMNDIEYAISRKTCWLLYNVGLWRARISVKHQKLK